MAKLYAKAPDGSDALLSIVITGFTQSLQQNGWCKLPNGLLFQWSELETDIDGDLSKWDYPIVFNQVFTIIGSCRIRSVYNEHCIFMYNNIQLDHVEYCINVNGDTNPVGQLSAYEHCKVYMLGI